MTTSNSLTQVAGGTLVRSSEYRLIELSLIDPDPNQPREDFDDKYIGKLARSIKNYTLLQAVTVKRNPDRPGRYLIVAGEQRFRAMQANGVTEETFKVLSEEVVSKSYVLSAIENLQRRNLNPIEEANCIRTLHDVENMTWGEIHEMLGLDIATMINKLKLLELPEDVIEMVRKGTLPQVTALNLKQWSNDEGEYLRMAHDLIAGRNPSELHFKERTLLGDRHVQARLPKTPEDFAIRIIKVSGAAQSLPDVIQAFVMLSEEDQDRAFASMNPTTLSKLRIRFASLTRGVQIFSEKLEAYKLKTAKGRSAQASIARPAEPVVANPDPKSEVKRHVPPPASTVEGPLHAPSSEQVEKRSESLPAGSNGHSRKSPTDDDFKLYSMIFLMLFYSGNRTEVNVNLSRKALVKSIPGVVDIDWAIKGAIKLAKDYYRKPHPSAAGTEEQKFSRMVNKFRHDFGDTKDIDGCLGRALKLDRSNDPVNI